jgi:hypothetical protein
MTDDASITTRASRRIRAAGCYGKHWWPACFKNKSRRTAWSWNWAQAMAISSMPSRPGAGWPWMCWAGMLRISTRRGRSGHRITQLDSVADGSVDYVFSSNCFEHVSQPELVDCLAQLRRKMKPGAMLTIVQPNFKYCAREYFDDYTHVSIYTDKGLAICWPPTAFGLSVACRASCR